MTDDDRVEEIREITTFPDLARHDALRDENTKLREALEVAIRAELGISNKAARFLMYADLEQCEESEAKYLVAFLKPLMELFCDVLGKPWGYWREGGENNG